MSSRQSVGGPITQFITHHYRHFNAAALVDAARGQKRHLASGGKMMVTLAGAMSTAELGLSLAEMIRQDKVHHVPAPGPTWKRTFSTSSPTTTTSAFRTTAHLSKQDEQACWTGTSTASPTPCIPEAGRCGAWNRRCWRCGGRPTGKASGSSRTSSSTRCSSPASTRSTTEIDPKHSWMLAAAEKNLPIIVPGWEDSTLGNMFAAAVIRGEVKNVHTVRTGIEYMTRLAEYYTQTTKKTSLGMFQIGGGIAGDFPICVVPMLHQDLQRDNVPLWGYFCQISDSTTSYGCYSGAVPNEKITWGSSARRRRATSSSPTPRSSPADLRLPARLVKRAVLTRRPCERGRLPRRRRPGMTS